MVYFFIYEIMNSLSHSALFFCGFQVKLVKFTIEFIFLLEQEFNLVFYTSGLCFLGMNCATDEVFWNFVLYLYIFRKPFSGTSIKSIM